MLAAVGDLVEDVVVRLGGPIAVATDTEARIVRRRGGSAANVVAAAALLDRPARFLGQVGADATGAALVDDLARIGVDTQHVRRRGTSGTIVVLVDAEGERSMLTDRGTCVDLHDPDPGWLDDVEVLHVPLYSLFGGAIASTAIRLVGWAHDRGITVSLDLSSTALLHHAGPTTVRDLVAELAPTIVFANREEAELFGFGHESAGAIVAVKDGPDPAEVYAADRRVVSIPAIPIDGLDDSTGAGDAFAAGFLTTAGWGTDPAAACAAGHRAAHHVLTGDRP